MNTWLRPEGQDERKAGAYIGYSGLATILALTKTPIAPAALAEATGLNIKRAQKILKQFSFLGLVHRVGWVKAAYGFPSPIYLIGDGEDAPAIISYKGKPQAHADSKPKHIESRVITFASVVQCMDHPCSLLEISTEAGISRTRIGLLLKFMRRKEIGLAFIAAYERRADEAGPPTALWQYGVDQKDVARPKPNKRIRHRRDEIVRSQWANAVMELKRGAGIKRPKVVMSACELSEAA